MVAIERVHHQNNASYNPAGKYVLYWMDKSQRIRDNYALNFAIELANKYSKPLLVLYIIDITYPLFNSRQYDFLLRGMNKLRKDLYSGGIQLHIEMTTRVKGVTKFAKNAVEVVGDFAYLKEDRQIRKQLSLPCRFTLIESDITVPVMIASDKEEYAARTFRPKIHEKLSSFTKRVKTPILEHQSLNLQFPKDFSFYPKIKLFADKLGINEVAKPVSFVSGERRAIKHMESFVKQGLPHYNEGRNLVGENYQSDLSPYLNFGQISPIRIINRVSKLGDINSDRFLEQLIVRRELSHNFVYFNENYDNFNSLPKWAKQTLLDHSDDSREIVYSLDKFEKASTHDTYWNAAQREMILTGKMHGYMRMYWGKKILEWSENPIDAYQIAIYLNNKYSIDGFSPNGYAGIAWCFGKHDTAWKERSIYGKVRYMNDKGLKRKFDMVSYIQSIDKL